VDPASGTDNDVSLHSVVADRESKSEAGGLKRLPLLLFGLGIVLVIDLQGLLLYNRVARVALIRKKGCTTILTCLGRQK